MSDCARLAGWLYHNFGPAVAKYLTPQLLHSCYAAFTTCELVIGAGERNFNKINLMHLF